MNRKLNIAYGAGEGNRTLIVSLEGFCFTTKLLPLIIHAHTHLIILSNIIRMVERAGFEPAKVEPPDLQSGPVGRLGNLSEFNIELRILTNNTI